MEKNKLPHYSKKGYLIEFPKYKKDYYIFILLRIISFIVDFAIPGILQFLMWSVLKKGIILSGFTTLMYYHIYYFISMTITKGRTLGTFITRQRIVHKSGFSTDYVNYYLRAFIMAVYALPYIGWIFMAINLASLFLMRGMTTFDILSRTICISERQYKILEKIEREDVYV